MRVIGSVSRYSLHKVARSLVALCSGCVGVVSSFGFGVVGCGVGTSPSLSHVPVAPEFGLSPKFGDVVKSTCGCAERLRNSCVVSEDTCSFWSL